MHLLEKWCEITHRATLENFLRLQRKLCVLFNAKIRRKLTFYKINLKILGHIVFWEQIHLFFNELINKFNEFSPQIGQTDYFYVNNRRKHRCTLVFVDTDIEYQLPSSEIEPGTIHDKPLIFVQRLKINTQ